jgi:hypothetical protein
VRGDRAGSKELRRLCDLSETEGAVEQNEIRKLTRGFDDRLETGAREGDAQARARQLPIAHGADQIVCGCNQYVRDVFHDRLSKNGSTASGVRRRFSHGIAPENGRLRLGLRSSVPHRPLAGARTLPGELSWSIDEVRQMISRRALYTSDRGRLG